MSKRTSIPLTIVTVILLAAAILAGYFISSLNGSGETVSESDEQKPFWPFGRKEPAVVIDDQHRQFSHPRYGFSVVVPKDLEAVRVDEGEGTETVVFIPVAEDAAAVMQIFVTPYLPHEITSERLAKDVPGGKIKDVTEVMIGVGSDIRAVRFSSQHPGLGEAREVWFLRNGYLFEVTTRIENDAWLATVLKTWQFSD